MFMLCLTLFNIVYITVYIYFIQTESSVASVDMATVPTNHQKEEKPLEGEPEGIHQTFKEAILPKPEKRKKKRKTWKKKHKNKQS